MCALRPENVVRFLADADRMRPAYCIALRPETRQVLLIVRGTKSIGDAITVLTGALAASLAPLRIADKVRRE